MKALVTGARLHRRCSLWRGDGAQAGNFEAGLRAPHMPAHSPSKRRWHVLSCQIIIKPKVEIERRTVLLNCGSSKIGQSRRLHGGLAPVKPVTKSVTYGHQTMGKVEQNE
jgi:hypothetical protein